MNTNNVKRGDFVRDISTSEIGTYIKLGRINGTRTQVVLMKTNNGFHTALYANLVHYKLEPVPE